MINSPTIFQYFMNNIFVIVYLDNIMTYFSLDEHGYYVCHILKWLQSKVKYVGVIVTLDGICMDSVKVEAILNWPPPQNVKEVQWTLDILCPVTFYTHSMIAMDLNYNIYKKELLAIVETFKQWWAYLK
ncbi:hypothetical protein C0993_000311 [Termitomyces sp. T159_Od127]|nr:hypothetical protein C0993_000311 [Termitomyces sp. T159_Od127]